MENNRACYPTTLMVIDDPVLPDSTRTQCKFSLLTVLNLAELSRFYIAFSIQRCLLGEGLVYAISWSSLSNCSAAAKKMLLSEFGSRPVSDETGTFTR